MASTSDTGYLCVSEVSWRGVLAYKIQNDHIAAVIVPSLGAKIASLVSQSTGREWMWQNPEYDPGNKRLRANYIWQLGGWDECFPSISATKYPWGSLKGIDIPDHGELWSQEWLATIRTSKRQIELSTRVEGKLLPYKFERVLSLQKDSSEMRLRYTVDNLSQEPMPFIWSSHPTIAVRPGDRMLIPQSELTLCSSVPARFGEHGDRICWPEHTDTLGHTWDFSILPGGNPQASLKAFTLSGATGTASVIDSQTGSRLQFEFNPSQIPNLGVWLNFDVWSVTEGGPKYYCIALEPCIADTDDLSLAWSRGTCWQIPAMGKCAWELAVRL